MHLSLPAKAARPPAGNWYYQFFGDYGPRGLRGQYRRESGQRQGRAPEGAALDGQSCRSVSRPGPSREWRGAARGSDKPWRDFLRGSFSLLPETLHRWSAHADTFTRSLVDL